MDLFVFCVFKFSIFYGAFHQKQKLPKGSIEK